MPGAADYITELSEFKDYINEIVINCGKIKDCDKIKFGESEEDLGHIISKVDSTLYGLF